jgi:hypothetical protein
MNSIKGLIKAIETRRWWNTMPVEQFVFEYHKYLKMTPEETGYTDEWINHTWKMTGLLNTDLLNKNFKKKEK